MLLYYFPLGREVSVMLTFFDGWHVLCSAHPSKKRQHYHSAVVEDALDDRMHEVSACACLRAVAIGTGNPSVGPMRVAEPFSHRDGPALEIRDAYKALRVP